MNTVLYARVSFNAAVAALGEPQVGCDKIHVEWTVDTPHGVVSVYDYGDLGACCHRAFYEAIPADFDDYENLVVPDPADDCPLNPRANPDALPPRTVRDGGAFHVNADSPDAAQVVWDRLTAAYLLP